MKTQEFSIDIIKPYNVEGVLASMFTKKLSKITIHGVTTPQKVPSYSLTITDEQFKECIADKSIVRALKKIHTTEQLEKQEKFDRLKARADACLFDVKPYIKLLEVLDEFSYCQAINELEYLLRLYTKPKAASKAIYRARLSTHLKIDCV